jgi:Zn-dependent protease with chaperone function
VNRRWLLAGGLVGLVATGAAVAVLTPWQVLPAGAPTVRPDVTAVFTPQQIERVGRFRAAIGAWPYAAIAASASLPWLVVAGASGWRRGRRPGGAPGDTSSSAASPGASPDVSPDEPGTAPADASLNGPRTAPRASAPDEPRVASLAASSSPDGLEVSRSARRRQILLVAGAAAAIVAGQWLVALPLGAHSEAVLRGYGISTQSWAGWLRDRAVGLLVSLAVTVLAMLLLWWLTRRAPQRWPWLLAGIAAAVTVAASTLYPLVVESLYTQVSPLPAGPMRTSIEQLAARDGLGDVRVVVSNASSRTTGENAHVSGLGATRRIALDDTLVARARTDPAAVLVVVAHELGHVRNQDVARGTTIAALAVPTGVLLLGWVLTSAGARRVFRPQATAPRQVVRSVALVLAITSTAPLLAAPVTNLVSRRIEAAADLHALQRTGDVAAFERIQHDLATSNLIRLSSAWWQTLLFETHPAPAWRIAMAQAWSRAGGSAAG